MDSPPVAPYCGLTIIMSNPSRFDIDNKKLLSGNAGSWFKSELQKAIGKPYFACDIRLTAKTSPLLPNTKVVLCLGSKAQLEWMRTTTTLGQQRGCPVVRDGIIFTSSFPPQDAFDILDFEERYGVGEEAESVKDFSQEKGRHGNTSRSNYRFWLLKDLAKVGRWMRHGLMPSPKLEYIRTSDYTPLTTVTPDDTLYFDLETDPVLRIRCLGFAINDGPTYCIPLLKPPFRYEISAAHTAKVLQTFALAHARVRRVVAHNGSGFDWLVLCWRYKLDILRWNLYDTMLAAHRIYPDVEKSLGHQVSLHTDEPYHKSDGVYNPTNDTEQTALLFYCAKDVHTMRMIYKAQQTYTECASSIAQANASIVPYLRMALRGFPINIEGFQEIISHNDRLMTQMIRWAKVLTGVDDGKFLGSNKQLVKYFHEDMGFPIVRKSKETGEPSLNKEAIFDLAMRLGNEGIKSPVLDLVLAYRALQKEAGDNNFTLWNHLSEQVFVG